METGLWHSPACRPASLGLSCRTAALASTPIINHPEVAIVGVNKIAVRPFWDGSSFVPRKVMNLSSSFDHRVVNGWDAAVFIQRIKTLLQTPALIFIEG